MRPTWGRIAWWLLHAVSSLALTDAQNVQNRFRVDLTAGRSTSGSCGWIGANDLNSIYADVITLAASGLDVIMKYNNDMEATRLVDAFFQSKSTKTRLKANQVATIQGRFQQISNWLNNGGNVNGGGLNVVPDLFCHDTWAQPQTLQSQAYNNQGQLIFNRNNNPVTLRQVPQLYKDYVDVRQQNPTAVPIYSYVHIDYFYDLPYGTRPNDFVCAPANSEAQTMFFNNAFATVTLCPKSFGTGSQTPNNPSIRTLGQVQPMPVTLADYKTRLSSNNLGGLQKLEDLLATAVTLYHEVFHLVLGAGARVSVPSNGQEIYGVDLCLGATAANAALNPETYAYVANAWWITQNQKFTTTTGSQTVEFFTGYSTY